MTDVVVVMTVVEGVVEELNDDVLDVDDDNDIDDDDIDDDVTVACRTVPMAAKILSLPHLPHPLETKTFPCPTSDMVHY